MYAYAGYIQCHNMKAKYRIRLEMYIKTTFKLKQLNKNNRRQLRWLAKRRRWSNVT